MYASEDAGIRKGKGEKKRGDRKEEYLSKLETKSIAHSAVSGAGVGSWGSWLHSNGLTWAIPLQKFLNIPLWAHMYADSPS